MKNKKLEGCQKVCWLPIQRSCADQLAGVANMPTWQTQPCKLPRCHANPPSAVATFSSGLSSLPPPPAMSCFAAAVACCRQILYPNQSIWTHEITGKHPLAQIKVSPPQFHFSQHHLLDFKMKSHSQGFSNFCFYIARYISWIVCVCMVVLSLRPLFVHV